jgi:cation transport regulator ChaB
LNLQKERKKERERDRKKEKEARVCYSAVRKQSKPDLCGK